MAVDYAPNAPALRGHVRGRAKDDAHTGVRRRGDGRRVRQIDLRPRAAPMSASFANPKSSTFTVPSSRTLRFAVSDFAWDDACSCAASKRGASCLRWQALHRPERAMSKAIRDGGAFDESITRLWPAWPPPVVHFLEPVDGSDVWGIERREEFGFVCAESGARRAGSSGERRGKILMGTCASISSQSRGRPPHTAHASGATTRTGRGGCRWVRTRRDLIAQLGGGWLAGRW